MAALVRRRISVTLAAIASFTSRYVYGFATLLSKISIALWHLKSVTVSGSGAHSGWNPLLKVRSNSKVILNSERGIRKSGDFMHFYRQPITESSAGARVFAAWGKRLCRRPHQSDQFCNQGIFQDFGHGCVNQPLGSPTLPLSFPSIPSPSHTPIFHPFPSFRSGPLKSS